MTTRIAVPAAAIAAIVVIAVIAAHALVTAAIIVAHTAAAIVAALPASTGGFGMSFRVAVPAASFVVRVPPPHA